MTLHLLAPAKLNLTLEVLGKREDGYHEIASIMQTIDLADRISISEADELQFVVMGPEEHGTPANVELNLAYQAAVALRAAAGVPVGGARIELEKRIPAGAGLGGGSSDAAAVLRGLSRLWDMNLPPKDLASIAASLGSDVPFFLAGGTALATGRGEVIEQLPDMPPLPLVLFLTSEQLPDKTRSMYANLKPDDFGDASVTDTAVHKLRSGEPLKAQDMINAFDRAVAAVAPSVGVAMKACRSAGLPVLAAGAGPSFFSPTYLGLVHPSLLSVLEGQHGIVATGRRTISAAEALAVKET